MDVDGKLEVFIKLDHWFDCALTELRDSELLQTCSPSRVHSSNTFSHLFVTNCSAGKLTDDDAWQRAVVVGPAGCFIPGLICCLKMRLVVVSRVFHMEWKSKEWRCDFQKNAVVGGMSNSQWASRFYKTSRLDDWDLTLNNKQWKHNMKRHLWRLVHTDCFNYEHWVYQP